MKTVRFENECVVPSKVICIGRNYVDHITELGNAIPDEMVVFNKPNSSIGKVLKVFHQEPLHYEAEICLLVQNGEYAAVGLGLDLTKRGLQSKLKEKGLPWERAKAFDGSAIFSRFVPISPEQLPHLTIELVINSMRMQKGHVEQMLYPPHVILSELNQYTTLEDNDIVMTGTPKGVGQVHPGDRFVGRIQYKEQTLIEVEWIAA
ncbi:fumarylacetoacetate hydrolase family protein [Vibrio maerlii]|uniref:fumarylacetoacetate hydrolase family protein n=1 Tax=Vibrio maerlii TaxID=2231648 RepID=UPI000E3C2C9F|nr:fumarylacetoacetate hydrolase family protein [Vibrio maerlii]